MTLVETTATSGAVLGVVAVLLLQQLGLLALSDLLTTVITFVVAVVVGALVFAIVGTLAERR